MYAQTKGCFLHNKQRHLPLHHCLTGYREAQAMVQVYGGLLNGLGPTMDYVTKFPFRPSHYGAVDLQAEEAFTLSAGEVGK